MIIKIIKVFFTIILVLAFLVCAIVGYVIWENKSVDVSEYSVYSEKLPSAFDGYKILMLADFHDSVNYNKITEKISKLKPNIIVLVGDMINSTDTSFENFEALVDRNSDVAPIYFVSGNHEKWSEHEKEFLEVVKKHGIINLNNKSVKITYQNNNIALTGFEDVVYADAEMRLPVVEKSLKELSNIKANQGLFNILLFHRANLFDTVIQYPFDLVLSGHLHGGQIGLPFVGDFLLSQRHKSDKYIKGYYRSGDSQLVVSAGLSEDMANPRVLNPPELVMVTLKSIK